MPKLNTDYIALYPGLDPQRVNIELSVVSNFATAIDHANYINKIVSLVDALFNVKSVC